MVERHLGVALEKVHSAVDWSTRPLAYDWLAYAALDVELLVDLRDALGDELERAGKSDWAAQEFEAVRLAGPPPPRTDPWRRTSGIHKVRSRRQLAAVRALWEARDAYAAERDIAPGRVLPDSAIIDAAQREPAHRRDLLALPVFGGPRQRRRVDRWFAALQAARALPDSELPPLTGPGDGVPAASRWRERDPAAAARLAAAREVITRLAAEHTVLVQNLLASDVVRRLCWAPPKPLSEDSIRNRLAELGARPWQIDLCAAPLAAALAG
jgi:ribonuclease D